MPVFNLRGERGPETVTVELLPGFGIQHRGEHLEGGPHELPAEIALQLVHTHRARIFEPGDVPLGTTPAARDPEPVDRDDVPRGRNARTR